MSPAPRPAGLRTIARAVAWRSIHNFLTNPAFLVPAIVFPLFFFVSFAGGLSAIANVPGFDFPSGYTAFQFVFVLLQSAAFGGVFTGFGIARDFETGFAQRYLLAACNRGGIVAGYALAALVRAFITWTVLTVIALVAGMNVDGSGVELLGLYGLADPRQPDRDDVGGRGGDAGALDPGRAADAVPGLPDPLPRPVYVPLGLLSGWIHAVASVNPVTALLEAGRGFISGDPTVVALAFAIAVVLPVVFALWARGGLRRAEAAG